LTSIATVLVKTATSFYLLRFLLGAFEAGLLPGAALGTHVSSKGLGVRSNLAIGWLSAVPNIAAVICLIAVGRHSDRTLERRYHSALLCLVAAGGLTMIGLFTNHPLYAFLGLVLGTMGGVSAIAPFWQFPPMLLAGGGCRRDRAHQLDWQFLRLGRSLRHRMAQDTTGTTSTGLYVVAGLEVLAAVLILAFMPRQDRFTGKV
jgi:MFS family permease